MKGLRRRLGWTRGAALALGAVASLGMGREVVLAPAHTFVENDGEVERAVRDELRRSMTDLKMEGSPRPYFLAYELSDLEQATATATFGALTGASSYRGRTLRTEVRVGDPKFDNSNTTESLFGGSVESLPVDDDYAALRRELWLRTDEAYKAAVEALAKKKSAASGQASAPDDAEVPDFSSIKKSSVAAPIPFAGAALDAEALVPTVTSLSRLLKEAPEISGGRVTATYATIRRRFSSSEGASSDEKKGTMRVDAVAETQAPDGMRLVHFVTFTALDPSGLPAVAEMQRAVRQMVHELVLFRSAPVAPSGIATVLFEGPAAAQIVKLLVGDNLAGTPAPRTAGGSEERSQSSEFADWLGQKIASPLLMAVDDPLRESGSRRRASPRRLSLRRRRRTRRACGGGRERHLEGPLDDADTSQGDPAVERARAGHAVRRAPRRRRNPHRLGQTGRAALRPVACRPARRDGAHRTWWGRHELRREAAR